MENGENGATGASARQNILTELKFAIDFVIRQHQNIAGSIVRWVEGNCEFIEAYVTNWVTWKSWTVFDLLSYLGLYHRNKTLQWSNLKHLGIFLRTEDVRSYQQLRDHGRSWAKLPVRLHHSLAEIKAKENVGIVVTSVPWTWERHVDHPSEKRDFPLV